MNANHLLMPFLGGAIAFVATSLSFFLGVSRAAWLLCAIVMAVGGVSYFVSSNALQAFLMITAYGSPFILGSAVLGIAAGQSLKRRRFLLAVCLLVPFPYFIWHTENSIQQSTRENQLALNFTLNDEQLKILMGGPFEVYPASSTTYQAKAKGRYEYSVKGRNDRYVIIDVFRDSDSPRFSIACVTTLSMGKREAGMDDCQQATVPLPQLVQAQPIIPPDAAR